MELNLKPMSKLEQQYSYSHDEAVDAATRCLGHLRGDMGSTGKAFYFTWFDHCGELKTPAFKSEFDDVIKIVASGKIPVEKVVTRTIDLDHIVEEGFDVLAFDKEGKELKIQVKIRD